MSAVWPLVVKDMLDRNEEGAKKYNRYLQTNCPDDMLQHAYEEALDLAVYLKTLIERQKQWTSNNIKTGQSTQQCIPEQDQETSKKSSTLCSDSPQSLEKWQENLRKSSEETKLTQKHLFPNSRMYYGILPESVAMLISR